MKRKKYYFLLSFGERGTEAVLQSESHLVIYGRLLRFPHVQVCPHSRLPFAVVLRLLRYLFVLLLHYFYHLLLCS
jgi:hypothetical protein